MCFGETKAVHSEKYQDFSCLQARNVVNYKHWNYATQTRAPLRVCNRPRLLNTARLRSDSSVHCAEFNIFFWISFQEHLFLAQVQAESCPDLSHCAVGLPGLAFDCIAQKRCYLRANDFCFTGRVHCKPKNPIDLRSCFFVLPPLRDFVHATRRPLLFLPCADFRVVGVTRKGRRWRFVGRGHAPYKGI